MLIRPSPDLRESDITDETLYFGRRRFLAGMAGAGMAAAGSAMGLSGIAHAQGQTAAAPLSGIAASPLSTSESRTSYEDITTYNNFYEFGADKSDPVRNSQKLKIKPWSVVVDGEVARPGTIAYEDLIKPHKLEERVYRLRCVEGWSMVIPWIGVPLADVLARFEPTSNAKFVVFETLYDPAQMPGQKTNMLSWPYREGLRLDEAMHPLTLLAVGLYGRELLPQNGAPIRLVVPWKYGFKSIKSIVSIRLSRTMPQTTWMLAAPYEYGFYANVNPDVSHPRWSQRKERRLGDASRRNSLFGGAARRDTLLFNGYADQVASLYAEMDLRKNF